MLLQTDLLDSRNENERFSQSPEVKVYICNALTHAGPEHSQAFLHAF